MKSYSLLKLLSILFLFGTPALAQMTADQHYEKGRQENTDAKYLDSIADFDAAIKLQPDYWKAYANRAAAEYNAKRYQVALNDLNTAMAHLPPGKGLTDLKAMIERAMQPAPDSAEMTRRMIALQGLQRLAAIESGAAYPGQFGGPAYSISQLANTLTSHGYKIPNNLVNPNTTPSIHPLGESTSKTSQAGAQSQTSASEAKLAALVGSSATTPQSAAPKASTLTTKIVIAKNKPTQAHDSESEAKLDSITGSSGSSPTTSQPAPPQVPDTAQKYLDSGVEKSRAGDWAGAIADLDEYIKLDPNNFVGYANRGTARLQNGETEGAIVDLDKAVKLMPDNPNTRDFRDNLKAAIDQARQSLRSAH